MSPADRAQERERLEQERIAREAAARAEQERLEQERLAREAAERAEQERIAREAAERAEQERLAAAASEAPPASVRQPRDELRPLDTALPGLEDEEPPPASGEISSQRQPTAAGEPPAVEVRLVAQPAPVPAPALAAQAPAVVEVAADVTVRFPLEGDAASFLGAVRAERPASFGELLDAALSLGA